MSHISTDQPKRSLIKGITWRVTGTLDTMLISYLITGKLDWAITIGGIEIVTKMFLYYIHERIWDRIRFGKKAPEYQI